MRLSTNLVIRWLPCAFLTILVKWSSTKLNKIGDEGFPASHLCNRQSRVQFDLFQLVFQQIGLILHSRFLFIYFFMIFQNYTSGFKIFKLYHNRHIIRRLGPTTLWYSGWMCYNVPTVRIIGWLWTVPIARVLYHLQPPYQTAIGVGLFWKIVTFLWTRMEINFIWEL
jgi:hypothetical protein